MPVIQPAINIQGGGDIDPTVTTTISLSDLLSKLNSTYLVGSTSWSSAGGPNAIYSSNFDVIDNQIMRFRQYRGVTGANGASAKFNLATVTKQRIAELFPSDGVYVGWVQAGAISSDNMFITGTSVVCRVTISGEDATWEFFYSSATITITAYKVSSNDYVLLPTFMAKIE